MDNTNQSSSSQTASTIPVIAAQRESTRQLKRLIGSPHFKFASLTCDTAPPAVEVDEITRPSSGREPKTPETPLPQKPAKTNSPAADPGDHARVDAAHLETPPTHLPKKAIEQFVGWSELAVAAGSESAIQGTNRPMGETSIRPAPKTMASFDDGYSLDKSKVRIDSSHSLPDSDNSPAANIESTAGTGSMIKHRQQEQSEIFARTRAIDELVRKAFSDGVNATSRTATPASLTDNYDSVNPPWTTRSARTAATGTHHEPGQVEVDSGRVESHDEIIPATEVIKRTETIDEAWPDPVERQSDIDEMASWKSIEEVESPVWPEMTDKMLTLGRPVLERLAETVNIINAGAGPEIAVAGAGRRVGTTTICMSLARMLAAQGEKVLLVDADIHSADLTQTLGLTNHRSWMTLVQGTDILQRGMVRIAEPDIAFATLTPLRLRTIWPPFVLDHLAGLLARVRNVFDRIIIDAGTTHQMQAELSGNRQLSATAIIVTEMGKVDEEVGERIRHNLEGIGMNRAVFAQNFARTRSF